MFTKQAQSLFKCIDIDPQPTMDLLTRVSTRLSGRADCKKLEYCICISELTVSASNSDAHRYYPVGMVGLPIVIIVLYPDVAVYPDNHHRKASDKQSLLMHLFNTYFSDVSTMTDTYGNIVTTSGIFVPGNYVYTRSISGKYRHWMNMEDCR